VDRPAGSGPPVLLHPLMDAASDSFDQVSAVRDDDNADVALCDPAATLESGDSST
jgi:hypothetical protein